MGKRVKNVLKAAADVAWYIGGLGTGTMVVIIGVKHIVGTYTDFHNIQIKHF